MEVGSPEWIESSIARLDELEAKHASLESELETINDPAALAAKSRELETVDAELKSLMAQLEAVAGEDEVDEGGSEAAAADAPGLTQGDDELSAPHAVTAAAVAAGGAAPIAAAAPAAMPAATPAASPFGAPADDPFGSPPLAATGFDAPPPTNFDDDLKPAGGGGKWVFLGLVAVVGLGIGGFFAFQNMQANKAKDAKPDGSQEVQVIKAAEVPDDTEAPPTAPSGTASVSPNAGDEEPTKKKKKKKDEKKKIKLGGGDAPLGGI